MYIMLAFLSLVRYDQSIINLSCSFTVVRGWRTEAFRTKEKHEVSKERQRITIGDVAREAGVPRATVGFVLSNNPHQSISPATREKVQQAARRLGYRSFAPARLLRTGNSSIVLGHPDDSYCSHLYLSRGTARPGPECTWFQPSLADWNQS